MKPARFHHPVPTSSDVTLTNEAGAFARDVTRYRQCTCTLAPGKRVAASARLLAGSDRAAALAPGEPAAELRDIRSRIGQAEGRVDRGPRTATASVFLRASIPTQVIDPSMTGSLRMRLWRSALTREWWDAQRATAAWEPNGARDLSDRGAGHFIRTHFRPLPPCAVPRRSTPTVPRPRISAARAGQRGRGHHPRRPRGTARTRTPRRTRRMMITRSLLVQLQGTRGGTRPVSTAVRALRWAQEEPLVFTPSRACRIAASRPAASDRHGLDSVRG
jgi:hypothetical protein